MIEISSSLRFGRDENGIPWLRRGWSKPETDFVWSMGTQSTVTVPLIPGPGRVFLELTVKPFVHPPELPAQRLDVVVNGALLARRRLVWQATLRMEVPASLRQQPGLLVELRHPDAATPSSFGLGRDPRLLGVQLFALTVLRSGPRDELPRPAGPAIQEAGYRFGGNETSGGMLLEGWGTPEIDYVWSVGRRSTLRLQIGKPAAPRMVLLDMQPYLQPPAVPRQRIAVGANDQLLGFVSLGARGCNAFALPRPAPGADHVVLSFDNLDAAEREVGLYADGRPFAFMLCRLRLLRLPDMAPRSTRMRQLDLPGYLDDGTLQQSVQAATGQSAGHIAAGFEALGSACELSLLQRRLGAEPHGLLRFSGLPTPELVDGLFEGFWGLGRPDKMDAQIHPESDDAYFVLDHTYALHFQTSVSAHTTDEDRLKRQMARGLPFLVRNFFADIVAAEKIFVFQRRDGTTRPEADAVLAALSIWGDATLLWVQQDRPLAGGVERLSPRLLHGFVDDDGVGGAGSDESWLRLLAACWVELREE